MLRLKAVLTSCLLVSNSVRKLEYAGLNKYFSYEKSEGKELLANSSSVMSSKTHPLVLPSFVLFPDPNLGSNPPLPSPLHWKRGVSPLRCVLSHSVVCDSVTPWTVACQAPPGDLSNPRIKPRSSSLQADSYHLTHQGSPRILEWVASPFYRVSSQPRNQTGSPALQAGSLPAELSGRPLSHSAPRGLPLSRPQGAASTSMFLPRGPKMAAVQSSQVSRSVFKTEGSGKV